VAVVAVAVAMPRISNVTFMVTAGPSFRSTVRSRVKRVRDGGQLCRKNDTVPLFVVSVAMVAAVGKT
jgi:hypothetical protein